jgi:hypothetical protein
VKGGISILGRTRSYEHAGSLEKRQAILDALAKATADGRSANITAAEPGEEVGGYYTLTLEELAALVNGDMEKIGSWVSNLDRHHATWLLRWLIKERQ